MPLPVGEKIVRKVVLVGLLAVSTCWAQDPASNASSQPQPQAPAVFQPQTITIPAGTRIPSTLASPITTKSGPGTAIRAVTTFPVTVGTQLAIPVGTYFEGVIDKVTKGGRYSASVQMHFTRIIYANGFGTVVNGVNVQAKALLPRQGSPETTAFAGGDAKGNALAAEQLQGLPPFQQPPPPPTLQKPPGPNVGIIVGSLVATVAVAIIAIVIASHHRSNSTAVLFDTGW
ncbi:MAG: hypothetical protein ACRD2S_00430, partial [Terriglobales bacterium]